MNQLQAALDAVYPCQAMVTNNGQGSKWSTWGLENLKERVLEKNPDTVFIEFSMNDAFLPYETSVETAGKNLRTMIDAIKEHNPETEIIIMIMNPPTGVHRERRPNFMEYNRMYREVVKERNLLLIDHEPHWEAVIKKDMAGFLEYVPDGIHPAPVGCEKIITPHILKSVGLSPRRITGPSDSR